MEQQKKTLSVAEKLKIYDKGLGLTLILILASGIQLEATSGQYIWSVWVHIILGLLLIILSYYHIYLHYKTSNWFKRFAKNKSLITRILWWLYLLTSVTGIIATISWFDSFSHTVIGAVHGKIGFLMALFGIIHAIKQKRKRMNAKTAANRQS